MTNVLYVFQYFRVVPPIPRLMTGAFVAITFVGVLSIVFASAHDASAVVPVIVLQAFSAATGFSAPARRGYFDLLLARGEPRTRIAAVQWLTAITPGVASWATLAAVDALVHGPSGNPLLRSGTFLALGMASTIPWAVTVSLPRFSGAIGWLLVVALGTVGDVIWPEPLRQVLFPIGLIGQRVAGQWEVCLPALLLSLISVACALWWVHRTDIRLEAAQ